MAFSEGSLEKFIKFKVRLATSPLPKTQNAGQIVVRMKRKGKVHGSKNNNKVQSRVKMLFLLFF